MGRNKVLRVPIDDERVRKSTLQKRADSLFKKATEIASLCDVSMAVVIQDPADDQQVSWPSRGEAETLLTRFIDLPNLEKQKKMTSVEAFLTDAVKNKVEKVKRLKDKNDEKEMAYLVEELKSQNIKVEELDDRQTDCLIIHLTNAMKNLHGLDEETVKGLKDPEQPQQQQHQGISLTDSTSNEEGSSSHYLHSEHLHPLDPNLASDPRVAEYLYDECAFLDLIFG